MARWRIGQEHLIARPEPRAASSLSEIAALLDWTAIDRHLVNISAAAKGEPGWMPLALFQCLLLATWRDLSDVRLAEGWTIAPASVGSAALPRARRHLSAPPSSGSAPSLFGAAWIGCCSRRSRVNSRPRA
jgi:hypothetical protein